jgi:predicted nuclease of predicted toxin-antitoxin system
MTRWLLDENIPSAVGRRFGAMGHDVAMVVEVALGATDEEILSIAREQHRFLVSFDRDFGDLIFGRGVPAPGAVVYLRVAPPSSIQIESLADLLTALESDLLEGHFTVVSGRGVRRRRLPISTGSIRATSMLFGSINRPTAHDAVGPEGEGMGTCPRLRTNRPPSIS